MVGAVIAIFSLFTIIFLFVISIVFDQGTSYLGLFIFIVLPVFLVIGLLLIPVGMLIRLRKDKKRAAIPEKKWPSVDFNISSHRNAFFIFAISTVIFLLFTGIGSYEAFHYTESVEFCGKLCHQVMEPEYDAYKNSPHASVSCVECHVGPGANWYVRSKLAGLYQVYAVTLNKYPKPIPTPITNLRPARETCEKCHWPEKFYAHQLRIQKYYLADEKNTEWDISLKMKIGSQYSALGLQEGIHWHINPDIKIEYIPGSEDREYLPWVKYTNLETGESSIYQDQEFPLDKAHIDSLPRRVMDCMDCHNRPSHDYKAPEYFIDNAFTAGIIPKELPKLKKLLVTILNEVFSSTDSAMIYLETEINSYYKSNYPEIYNNNRRKINKAIKGIQDEFKKNVFPEMKVQWDVYPNHIGHTQFNGCFRCHNDSHMNEKGKVISKDCNLCHTIIAQGNPDSLEVSNVFGSLEFKHPVDIEEAWKEYLCTECHSDLY